LVPIIPENAPRIRRAIQQARSEAGKAWHKARAMNADTNLLMMEFENHFNRAEKLARDYHLTKGEYESLQMIHEYVSGRVNRLEEALERSPRATVDEE
jgi:hypothetical protein